MKANHKRLPSWPDSFFNRAVQKVMRRRFAPEPSKGQTRQEQMAFPIEAFHAIDELASDRTHSQKHIDLLWFYGCDPQWCAELLLAVTEFHQSPDNRTDGELLAEEVESMRSDFDGAALRRQKGQPVSVRPTDWKVIAKHLSDRIEPLKGREPSADTLRTSIYPHEVKRRWEILKDWQPHIKAWAKVQTNSKPQ